MQSHTDSNSYFSASSRHRRQTRERWTDEETARLCALRERDPDIPWADFQLRYNFSRRSAIALMQHYSRNRDGGGSRSSRPSTMAVRRQSNNDTNVLAGSAPGAPHLSPAPNRQGMEAQRRVTLGEFYKWEMSRREALGLRLDGPVLFEPMRYRTLPPIFPQATASVLLQPRIMDARHRPVGEEGRPQIPSHEFRAAAEESEPEPLNYESARRQIIEFEYDDSDDE
ncbi:hypothetical protein BDW69DRAFT_189319 [Aspergillus filifer]